MQDISTFGARVRLVASSTFPAGITLTQFADDTDPFDIPSLQIADKGMGANGDMLVWSKANPILITLGMVPNSEDDRNLGILFNNNRVGRNKFSSRDTVTITVVYPDGRTSTFSLGAITDGMPGQSAGSAGRFKSKTYAFAFEGLNQT